MGGGGRSFIMDLDRWNRQITKGAKLTSGLNATAKNLGFTLVTMGS